MDEATLRRATEPFFTTKEIGKGTGLGLAMVHGLAAQSGGAIRISSRPGSGTTVELWFPVAQKEANHRAPPPATSSRSVGALNVLLVDDDPLVAEGTVSMLTDLGYSTLVAKSGERALDIIRSQAPLDLVITDHAMPGMTGVQLAARIRYLRPNLPVVLATGYADLPDGASSGLPRLDKPYRMHKLATLIETLVSSSRQGRSGESSSPRSAALVTQPSAEVGVRGPHFRE